MFKTPRFQCRGAGLIPGLETNIPHAARPKKKNTDESLPPSFPVLASSYSRRALRSTCGCRSNLCPSSQTKGYGYTHGDWFALKRTNLGKRLEVDCLGKGFQGPR